MHKHCEQLLRRSKKLEEEQRQADMVEANKKASESGSTGSPELKSRRSRQLLLDPIRRWNSFHNSRDRKGQRTVLPYLQTLEQFRKQQENIDKSVTFANVFAESPSSNYQPMLPQGSESLEKASRVLGTNIANELIALSLANLAKDCRSPTRKQYSSPNLIDPTKNSPRNRRTSSDSYPIDLTYTTPNKMTKTFSTSNPEDLQNQKLSAMNTTKLSVESKLGKTPTHQTVDSLRKISISSTAPGTPSGTSGRAVPRVLALRTESSSELLASSPLSSSLPSDVGLTPPSAPQLPRRRFSVW